ncbi:TolC family protein [Flavobacterium subsaxonicum]|uniref:Transporter n=1 Tax=Flavobacterium subsaxonicum WB 4.1-42 = DSM 21790 TaxID=1121898 RepID=A0A0A2N198_9FLAO|nr:TolC family protein [Flavobacterium subsaxonicum]KGO94220.1 transporter [Flavobacterium subsaxonicum WB 4.1-42 = DSM 21790]
MRFYLYTFFCFFTILCSAQELLTVEDAVATALKNNYDIKLSANDLKIDEQNVSLANAGLLPNLYGSLSQNNNIQNSKQVRTDGTVQELENAKNNSLSYGVNLGWTIFDGFRMFARYDQLKTLEKLGETELKFTILTRVSDVMGTYFDLVQQQQMLKALDTAIVISNQRVTTADNRFKIGKAAKLEVLNAQVDLNTDQTNFLRQKELYQNTKTFLNELMARDLATDFKVADSVVTDDNLKLVDLMGLAEQQNPQIQIALINKRIAELNLKQVKSARYPQIGVTTGYVFTDSESSLGFARTNNSRGLNYGVTASINIFNGFLQKRNEKIAKIQIESNDLLIKQQTQSINSQLMAAYQTYLTNIELVELEARNVQIAEQNLDITMEKYRIGTITTLEVRTAQLNFVNAAARNFTAQYNAKISEVTLRELAGNLTF